MDLAESLIDNPEKLFDYKEFLQGLGHVLTRLPERTVGCDDLDPSARAQFP